MFLNGFSSIAQWENRTKESQKQAVNHEDKERNTYKDFPMEC